MSKTSVYAEDERGVIHLVHPAQGEFTLCGDSFDISLTENDADGGSWTECGPRPITCSLCAEVVKCCRGVRISGKLHGQSRGNG